MNEFSPLDIVLIVLGGILILRGFVRGFVREFFSLGALVVGFLGSFLLYKNGAVFLRETYFQGLKWVPEVLAFIAIFLVIYVICKVVQKLLNDIIDGLSLEAVDKALGCVFGIAEGIVAISLVLFVISIQPLFDPSSLLRGSFFANTILPLIIDTSWRNFNVPLNTAGIFALQLPG